MAVHSRKSIEEGNRTFDGECNHVARSWGRNVAASFVRSRVLGDMREHFVLGVITTDTHDIEPAKSQTDGAWSGPP